jgi:uncharacterized protein YfkK (UPF0435 family)
LVKIPDDLYPDATNVEDIIEEYVDLGFKAFRDYFPDKTSYEKYIALLEHHQDAEDLVEAGSYLYRIQRQPITSVRVVLFISLIEKITVKNHMDFASWFNSDDGKNIFGSLTKKENFSISDMKKIIRDLAEIYRQKYGARNNFADFIEKYVSKDDQFRLILLFRGWEKEIVSKYTSRFDGSPRATNIIELKANGFAVEEKRLMPKCYDWKMCYVELGSCIPEIGCLVNENPEKFHETIRSVAKLIYDVRSEIVHSASDKSLIEERGDLAYAGSINLVNGKAVQIEITRDELEKIFVKALKNYFDMRPRLNKHDVPT